MLNKTNFDPSAIRYLVVKVAQKLMDPEAKNKEEYQLLLRWVEEVLPKDEAAFYAALGMVELFGNTRSSVAVLVASRAVVDTFFDKLLAEGLLEDELVISETLYVTVDGSTGNSRIHSIH